MSSFSGDTREINGGARMTWMRYPDYHRGLYPYTCSVGLVASTAMSRLIKQHGDPAVRRWLLVLEAGGTHRPLELMWMACIDMASSQPIHDAAAHVRAPDRRAGAVVR